MKKIVVLTGAGISAPSGLKTFRDADGLWENHDIMEVASIEGFHKDPNKVFDFYNQRRRQLRTVTPNPAHFALRTLESDYNVTIITQNVDNLHEKAGSSNIIHLHGALLEVRPVNDVNQIYTWEKDLYWGDTDEEGNLLRPNIVWFGEAVPKIKEAAQEVSQADLLLIIGTSLQVYPAAGLVDFLKSDVPIVYCDSNPVSSFSKLNPLKILQGSAEDVIPKYCEKLPFIF